MYSTCSFEPCCVPWYIDLGILKKHVSRTFLNNFLRVAVSTSRNQGLKACGILGWIKAKDFFGSPELPAWGVLFLPSLPWLDDWKWGKHRLSSFHHSSQHCTKSLRFFVWMLVTTLVFIFFSPLCRPNVLKTFAKTSWLIQQIKEFDSYTIQIQNLRFSLFDLSMIWWVVWLFQFPALEIEVWIVEGISSSWHAGSPKTDISESYQTAQVQIKRPRKH